MRPWHAMARTDACEQFSNNDINISDAVLQRHEDSEGSEHYQRGRLLAALSFPGRTRGPSALRTPSHLSALRAGPGSDKFTHARAYDGFRAHVRSKSAVRAAWPFALNQPLPSSLSWGFLSVNWRFMKLQFVRFMAQVRQPSTDSGTGFREVTMVPEMFEVSGLCSSAAGHSLGVAGLPAMQLAFKHPGIDSLSSAWWVYKFQFLWMQVCGPFSGCSICRCHVEICGATASAFATL